MITARGGVVRGDRQSTDQRYQPIDEPQPRRLWQYERIARYEWRTSTEDDIRRYLVEPEAGDD